MLYMLDSGWDWRKNNFTRNAKVSDQVQLLPQKLSLHNNVRNSAYLDQLASTLWRKKGSCWYSHTCFTNINLSIIRIFCNTKKIILHLFHNKYRSENLNQIKEHINSNIFTHKYADIGILMRPNHWADLNKNNK